MVVTTPDAPDTGPNEMSQSRVCESRIYRTHLPSTLISNVHACTKETTT